VSEEDKMQIIKEYHIFNLYDITRAFFDEYYRKDREITKKDFEDINKFLKAIEFRLETLKEVINNESSNING
jgi:hypothetical protein